MWGEIMPVLNKNDLVKYLIKKSNNDLSPIKLQKALYFLFAIYGGMKRFLKNNTKEGEDFSIDSLSDDYLFAADFQAWAYGPVDKEVYTAFKNGDIADDLNILEFETKLDSFTKGFLDDFIPKIFNTGDFSLVDLSHDDECWKKNFNRMDMYHDNEISSEDIIIEYTNRQYV